MPHLSEAVFLADLIYVEHELRLTDVHEQAHFSGLLNEFVDFVNVVFLRYRLELT